MPPWTHLHHLVPPAPFHHLIVASPGGGPDWAEIVTAVATALLSAAGLVALFQLRESRLTRHTEAAARASSRWEDQAYVEAREQIDTYTDNQALRDALVLSMTNRTPDRHPLLRELSFFEELGAMEKLGAISLHWLDETMRDLVIERWKLWEPSIQELRKDLDPKDWPYKNFEFLKRQLTEEVRLSTRRRFSRWAIKRLDY
jgi:hypothetical protein